MFFSDLLEYEALKVDTKDPAFRCEAMTNVLLRCVSRKNRGVHMLCGLALSEGYGHNGPGVCHGSGQTEAYVRDMGLTGLASAWAMDRRRPKEYRHKVDAATRCSRVCPHTCPNLTWLD